jgi:hypothetical protein
MVVGDRTFTGDLVARLGLVNLMAGIGDRYPKFELAELTGLGPDLVLLPDEPYVFAPHDGPEAFPGVRSVLVAGRDLTWYGPSMAVARASLTERIGSALRSR